MNKYYLGLGSNLSNRRLNLNQAIKKLKENNLITILKYSSCYETKALLPDYPDLTTIKNWNLPFLNMAIEISSELSALELFYKIKTIEKEMGRMDSAPRWSPRLIDIDILWGDKETHLTSPNLDIPHREYLKRAFVLDSLRELKPVLFLQDSRLLIQHQPAWMGILNLTPDSFSDGGANFKIKEVQKFLDINKNHMNILDIGAQSTRPQAKLISAQEEWLRLQDTVLFLKDQIADDYTFPQISVDTFYGEVIERVAQNIKVDIINDVSGLQCPQLREYLKTYEGKYVLMHSLGVPPSTQNVLDQTISVFDQLRNWFTDKINELLKLGLNEDQIIVDPGIGFGKSQQQNIQILSNIQELQSLGFLIMVGHSRKSFMKTFSNEIAQSRDFESIGISMLLAQKGVDILRVHNPANHHKVWRGYSEVKF